MTDKIALEVAEAEFERFAEMMALDLDVESMEEEDRKSFDTQKGRVIRAIRNGSLIINDNGEPVYTTQRTDSEPITFYEPDGAMITTMDSRKKNEDVAKMYALMGSMTKTNAKRFSMMKMADLKVCQAVATLFLG